uniref:Uncharacterized protein n=1 Tax=Glossina brevipalpis TaxID=37001 RepID=A0A1A9WP05_9MUSC
MPNALKMVHMGVSMSVYDAPGLLIIIRLGSTTMVGIEIPRVVGLLVLVISIEFGKSGQGSSPLKPSYENFPLLPVSVTIYSSGILASCGVIIVIIRGWVKTHWGVIRSRIIIIVESLTSSSSRLLPVWICFGHFITQHVVRRPFVMHSNALTMCVYVQWCIIQSSNAFCYVSNHDNLSNIQPNGANDIS